MTILALGPFRLDTRGELLLLGDQPVALGRRAVAVLCALIERPGALVLKEALIEAARLGQVVEESNLTVQIAALRRALGSVPGGDRWVETSPRRGYRYVGPVSAEGPPEGIATLSVPVQQDRSGQVDLAMPDTPSLAVQSSLNRSSAGGSGRRGPGQTIGRSRPKAFDSRLKDRADRDGVARSAKSG